MLTSPAMALAQDAGGSTDGSSSAPTIQSDKDDYPPGAAVTLTGSNWQPGESVHIYVNDREGRTWERNADVSADETGAIEDRFDLPDWFVATYSVKATGAQSGVVATSFTDAVQVKVQGQSNPRCAGGGNCDNGFEGGPLTGWKELDKVPMRLKFLDAGTYSVVVSFNHASTSGNRIPGIQNLVDWSADTASGAQLDGTPQLDSSDAANWKYTVKVNVTRKDALLNFKAKLAAGSHAYPGSSLDVRVENTTGVSGDVAQISKPGVGPGSPDLAVSKTGPMSAAPDSTITYTLSYQNKSSAANQATGVELTDVLPGDVTYVPGSCSNTCTVQGNEVIWNLGNLAVGQTGSQTLSVQTPAGAASGTTYTNSAQILGAENDASIDDNYSSLTSTVTKVNQNPNAVDDSLTTDEDTAGSVNVLTNDTDPDGDTLTVTESTSPQNGSVARNGGSFTYTPNENFNGSDSFIYTVSDGAGGTATAKVTITVNPVNDAPAIDSVSVDGASVDEGSPATIRVTATDVDNQASELSYSFDCHNDITNGYEKGPQAADNGTCTYFDNGTYHVNVKVSDGKDSATDSTDVTVRNAAPVADFSAAPGSVDEGQNIDLSLTNVVDPGTLDTHTYRFKCGDAAWTDYGQTNTHSCSTSDDGTLVVKGQVRDDDGGQSPEYDETITIINIPPSVNGPENANQSSNEGEERAFDLGSFADPGADGPWNVSVNWGDGSPTTEFTKGTSGTLGDKAHTYDDNGTYTVKVTVSEAGNNAASGQASFKVTVGNVAPTATVGNNGPIDENNAATISFTEVRDPSGADSGALRYAYRCDGGAFDPTPSYGDLAGSSASNQCSFGDDGEYPVRALVMDKDGGFNVYTTNVVVNNVAPVAKDLTGDDDRVTTPEDTAKEITLEASNPGNDQVTFSTVSAPANGTLSGSGANLTYTPDTDFHGSDSFTFEVCDDDEPQKCDQGTVEILVTAVNDDPVAKADEYNMSEDTPITVNAATGVLHNDTDVDADSLEAALISGPEHGTLTLNPDGSFTYTPAANYTGSDTFTYKAIDPSNGEASATVTVSITATNDDPAANDDSGTTDEDTPLTIDVKANDSDVDGDILSITQVTQPQKGTVTIVEDKLHYVPNENYNNTAAIADAFSYTVSDGKGGTATANVTVKVNAVNDAPVAANDSYDVDEDGKLTIDAPGILRNDSDVDADNLTVEPVISGPAHGQLNLSADGSFTYTPDADYNGEDSFTYNVFDGKLDSDVARVIIAVNAKNDDPVAKADEYTMSEDGVLTVGEVQGVLRNDSDVDAGDELTATLKNGPANGTLTLNPDGSFTYTPNPNFNGEDYFTYTVSDGNNGTADATVKVTITAANDAPVATDDSLTTDEDMAKALTLSASDVDGDDLTYTIVSGPAHGTLSEGTGANRTYTPAANYHGPDNLTFRVSDGSLDSNVATVSITVNAANDKPVAEEDSATTDEDTAVSINVLANDEDPDGDPLSVVGNTLSRPAHGTVELMTADGPNKGNVLYTPDPSVNGTDSFTYEACDAQGECDTATVTANVTPINDAPVLHDDVGSTGEAAAVSNSFISQYASSKASTPTRLYTLNTAQRPYTLSKVGKDIVSPMNAIGYRSTDRSLYGYRLTGKQGIMNVNPNTGAARFLGNPRGLPLAKNYFAGDVSPDGSTYFLYTNNSGVLQKVNLTTFRASSVKLSSVINVADLAVSPTDGNLYGVANDGRLLRVDPRTGRVTTRSVVGLKPGGYGATWFTAEGDLIAYENGNSRANGTMTWIARPTTAPTVVSRQAGPSTHGNDGAAYLAPPNPAGLSVVVDVLANDGDPDNALDRNTLRIVQPPANGNVRVNVDKTITYTSGSSYRGTDSFSYEVCDDGAPQQCSTATVNITSRPIMSSTNPAALQKE